MGRGSGLGRLALLKSSLTMKKRLIACFAALLAAFGSPGAANSQTFTLDQVTDVLAPSTRGGAGTTYFGWETFDDPGTGNPIHDATPNIGTTTAGVVFATTNGENHRSGSGNLYVGTAGHTLYEQVSVATDGTVGASGTTTVIAQFVTAFGDFPGPITLSQINGINPVVVRGVNAAGEGHVWAKWQIPGNAASYTFTITGPAGVTAYSIDRIVVDTHWSSTTPQPDTVAAVSSPTFKMDQVSGVVAPTTRGQVNSTWFGWETFCEVGFDNVPINDSTPDIGTTTTGVSFVTTNGEDHISSSRNLYVSSGTLSEEVTVVTDGTAGSGHTTIIAQAVTAFGGFPGANLAFSSINGVVPQVVQTTNIAGKGQVWAKWRIPGNQATYTFTVTGPVNVSGWSFDKFVVDTYWNPTAYQPDTMQAGNPALVAAVDQVQDALVPSSRGNANTTWFGWESFGNAAGNAVDPIQDETPDIGTTSTGVSIVTQNGQDHLSSTNNIYAGTNGTSLHERVTVVTNAPQGTPATGANSGTTTIIAQAVAQAGPIRTPVYFGSINGIAPTVVTATNAAGKGQIWASWVIPGNPSSSYTFDITSDIVSGPAASISIDRLVVDTVWRLSGAQPDTLRASTPPVAHVLSAVTGAVTPSTRGNVKTTWFGWETFNNVNDRTMGVSVINDSTPDIGTTTTAGANFQTTNSEGHLLASGNLYFLGGTLAERITVPTNGTVGGGFTTIYLQIVSATGAPGGVNAFAGPITLDIDGTPPTYQIEGANAGGTGQLWAKWELPGNEASYTIDIAGPPNQAHFSFDRVVVDTHWSPTGFQRDSMADAPVSIATASPLPVGGVNTAYSATLAGTGGTAPYTFTTTSGVLPAGLSLTPAGMLEGTPTGIGTSSFTVQITDVNGLVATKVFEVFVTTTPAVTTTTLANALSGAAYSASLAVTGGTGPYAWSVSHGALPTGIALSEAGELAGTPTVAGVFPFVVQVEDANGFSSTQALSLTLINLTVATAPPLPGAVRNVAYSTTLSSMGGTAPYTWSISSGALPTGLTLTGAGVISGTPTAAGTATFTLRLEDGALFAVTKEFTLTVTEKFIAPAIHPVTFPVTTIGTAFSHSITAANYPKTFTAVGLPRGLKITPATGVISGRPEAAGVFNVQLQATNTGGKSLIRTVPLVVKALDAELVGTFTALVERDAAANTRVGSRVDLVTTSKGSFTVKITTGTSSKSATGFLAATAPQVALLVNGRNLTLSVSDLTGEVGGSYGEANVKGWRSTWNALSNPAESRAGYYSFALDLASSADEGVVSIPQGSGFATLTVSAGGAVVVAGKAADGETLTSAGPLGPDGEICFYAPLYKGAGSLMGELELAEDAEGAFYENTVSGTPTWFKPATVTRTYATTFGPLNLSATGAYLAATSKEVVLGLPETGLARLHFTYGGLDDSVTDPDVQFTYTDDNKVILPGVNPAKVSLTIHKATGAVGGKFTLTEATPPLVRGNVAFAGQIVRQPNGEVKAVGYFLLTQKPANATSSVLSGGVVIMQP